MLLFPGKTLFLFYASIGGCAQAGASRIQRSGRIQDDESKRWASKEPEALAKGNLHLVDENAWAPSFYTNCLSNGGIARTFALMTKFEDQYTSK